METDGNKGGNVFRTARVSAETESVNEKGAKSIKFLERYHLIGAFYPSHWYHFF